MNFSLIGALGLSALAILSGCTGISDGSLVRWDASIRSVVPRSAIPDGTDPRCAPPMANPTSGIEPQVAIVRLRVGRSPYDMAFWVPEGFDPRPGASVRVDSRRCKLWPTPAKK